MIEVMDDGAGLVHLYTEDEDDLPDDETGVATKLLKLIESEIETRKLTGLGWELLSKSRGELEQCPGCLIELWHYGRQSSLAVEIADRSVESLMKLYGE